MSAPEEVAYLVLKAVESKGAGGFYPRLDSGELPLERTHLDQILDRLRLNGYLELTDWTQEKGQGYRVTDAAREALNKPRLLERPAPRPRSLDAEEGEDPFLAAKRAVLAPDRPIATQILVVVTVAIFGLTYLAQPPDPRRQINPVMALLELAPIPTLIRHEWWRLVSYMFLHANLMHIACNGYALWVLGAMAESRWGRLRYLVVYFGAGIVGGIAGLMFRSNDFTPLVGASGGIAGLLTSVGLWAWLNAKYLPAPVVSAHLRAMGVNLVLLAFISTLPDVSMSAHAGGALAGVMLSAPMMWLGPTSPRSHRVFGALALMLIAAACVAALAMIPRPHLHEARGAEGSRTRQSAGGPRTGESRLVAAVRYQRPTITTSPLRDL